MSTSTPRSRKSRLGAAMASKAIIEADPSDVDEPEHKPPLALAPEPSDEDAAPDVPATPHAEPSAVEDDMTDSVTEPNPPEPVSDPAAAEPEVVEPPAPEPTTDAAPEPQVAPRRKKADAAPAPAQTAQVLAGVGQIDLGQDLTHLRSLIARGRDQRRYVEDLPPRTGKGTYLRLPVHIQDVLAEYCDRNDAPMADLVTALLDSYFRDVGALPPLGEGNRPVEKFFDKMRKETRSYDY